MVGSVVAGMVSLSLVKTCQSKGKYDHRLCTYVSQEEFDEKKSYGVLTALMGITKRLLDDPGFEPGPSHRRGWRDLYSAKQVLVRHQRTVLRMPSTTAVASGVADG